MISVGQRRLFWAVLGGAILVGTLWKMAPGGVNYFYRTAGYDHLQKALALLSDEYPGPDFCVKGGVEDAQARNWLEQALEALEKAREVKPADAQTWILLGRVNCLLGRLTEAEAAYGAFSVLRPGNPLGFVEGGFAYEEGGEERQGILLWQKAEVTATHFIERGRLDQKAKNFKLAEAQFRWAETLGGEIESSLRYVQYLMIVEKEGETEAAYEVLGQAIRSDRGWTSEEERRLAWFKWGGRAYTQGNFEEAIAALEKVVSLTPQTTSNQAFLSETYRFLGLAYWEVDQKELAVNRLAEAVNLSDENVWAHIHYGKLLYLSDPGQRATTVQEFARAVEIQPDNLAYWLTVIKFWAWVGESEQAQLFCEQALAKWESNAELMTQCKTGISP